MEEESDMPESLRESILSHGLIAICRRIYGDSLLNLAEALYKGGVRQMEVTFDQVDPDGVRHTSEAIEALCKHFPEMDFGAGTVLTTDQVDAAQQAGGTFIVSPNTDGAVIAHTKARGMVSIPGAMTPSEIVVAHQAGADIVKLFPAGYLGTGYIKDVTAPISHIKLLATGGVTVDNFASFLRAGCCGAGLGGTLCNKELINAGKWAELTELAAAFIRVFQEERGQ